MFFATDTKEIELAMEAKAPRPIREVILEHYPDCIIDCNGRAHAPYDGYECQWTGRQYRGGEYLPFETTEDSYVGRSTTQRRLWVYESTSGEIFSFEGTKTQVKAGQTVAKEQATLHDKNSKHVGEVKARQEFDLRLLVVFTNYGTYGAEYTHYMRDDENNSVVYKGTKKLDVVQGEKIKLLATVKNHWTSPIDGRKATYINRPKIL